MTESAAVMELQGACSAWLNADAEVARATGQRDKLRAQLDQAEAWVADAEAGRKAARETMGRASQALFVDKSPPDITMRREAAYREAWGRVLLGIPLGTTGPWSDPRVAAALQAALMPAVIGTNIDPAELHDWAAANGLTAPRVR